MISGLADTQMPLKELVIFHHDQEYLDDVRSLETYVAAELNVVNITYTSDEASIGIEYKATADWPTLGKKLRKDIGKVKAALPSLSSKACKDFISTGKIQVDGVDLITGDLVVSRYVSMSNDTTHESASDLDVIILLDIRRHADLEDMALLRNLSSRVNKLRKEAGLRATDKVDIWYEYDDGEEDVLEGAIKGNEEDLIKSFGGVPMLLKQLSGGRKVLGTEKRVKEAEDLGSGERFILTLTDRIE
jgi:isoleucyl-tRNA synthetase